MPSKKKASKKKTSKKSSPKKTVSKNAAKRKPGKKASAKPRAKVMAKGPAKAKKSSASVESLLKPGQPAPEFMLPNELGATMRLSDFRGKKLVLYFYPKDDTPGCTKESCDFRDSFARVQSAGAIVIGVSRDNVASHQKFRTKYSLPFSLLADEAGEICEKYGVWKEKSMYGRKYMGIERTTFLIDENGIVKKVYPKVSVTGHVDEVLKDLQGA